MTLSDHYNTSAIAELYYKKVKPERKYTRKQARDQFKQERNFNKKVLKAILTSIALEECKIIDGW